MLKKALIWAGLFCIIVLGTAISDKFQWHLPWYFTFLVLVLFVPNILFIKYALAKNKMKRLVVLAQMAFTSILMFICEITAIQYYFWGFFEDKDVLCGLYIGGVPFEEFFFYPLMLNVSLYAYLLAKSVFKETRTTEPGPQISKTASIVVIVLMAVFTALAIVIACNQTPEAGERIWMRDTHGNPIYAEGGKYHGWGITVAAGMAIALGFFLWGTRMFMDLKALIFAGFIVYIASMCIELVGIGRGWWVYNDRQLVGPKIFILPLESIFMYIIGVIFPAGVYETLRIYARKKEA